MVERQPFHYRTLLQQRQQTRAAGLLLLVDLRLQHAARSRDVKRAKFFTRRTDHRVDVSTVIRRLNLFLATRPRSRNELVQPLGHLVRRRIAGTDRIENRLQPGSRNVITLGDPPDRGERLQISPDHRAGHHECLVDRTFPGFLAGLRQADDARQLLALLQEYR